MQRSVAALGVDDLQHVFRRQRLEIEPVGGVVVGRHRFRIAVDHDGLVAGFLEREGGVTAAIVELDALPDAVRAAAQDDDLLLVGRRRFVGDLAVERRLIGRIHVGGGRGEFGGASVDALEHRPHAELARVFRVTASASLPVSLPSRVSEKPMALSRRNGAAVVGRPLALICASASTMSADLRQEPRIDAAGVMDQLVAGAEPHRLRQLQQPVRRRRAERCADVVLVVGIVDALGRVEAVDRHLVEPGEPRLQRAQRLLQAFLERAADRHGFADRFHRGGEHGSGAGEFLEGKARNFGDDVVDGRLERGRRRAAGDVVGDFVERVADRQLRRDLGDREAGRLRRQRRGARHARVHLDDHQPAVGRVDRELHVGAAGLHPDLAQHRDRGVAHDLVFLVGERQRRRDGDRIAGVHAHRIDVLDRADDDAIVFLVAHHLHLVFFPAQHRFLDQHLAGGRGIDAAFDDVDEFFFVVGDAAAGAAEREGRADDRRQPDVLERRQGLRQRLDLVRARRLQPDLGHRVAEQLAVLRLVDGLGGGADHLRR